MIRAEAKQIISDIDKAYRKFTTDEYKALEMAIQALSQEPTSEMVHVETLHQVMWERDIAIEQLHELGYEFGQKIEPCTDAVSRQIISDYVESHILEINAGYGDLNQHTNRILRMIVDYIDKLPPVNPQPCDDAISREWLMRKATERFYITNYFNHISAMIEEAPSVTQKSKTGRWIELGCVGNDNYNFECSECHHTDTHSKTVKVNYCWYCGARMVEPQESEDKG